ncbi:MAG: carboxypeptidase regulatory-like domain-containing protein [Pyrinomonadaceae bacterium]
MKNFRFILAVLTFCFFAASASAQSNTGSLVGTVVDSQGGVVPGATVTVIDNATGTERTVQASGGGTFTAPQLNVGTYTVKVTAPGFKTYTATELKIDIGKEYSLNIALEPGGVSENVTVVAGADVVNSTSGELSTTVGQRQIQELPLNGRNPLGLIGLQAGTASNGATSTTINGQQTSFTNITKDGINIQDNFIRSNATDFSPDRPNVDDVGEFTISTQNAGAEKGYGSSQVEFVTPRGSSDFHGAAFIYNRNSKFASNTFINNKNGTRRPFLNRNQFGGKLSGPMPLPRFGEGGASTYQHKGFFFGSWERFRLRQSTTTTRTILLPNARTGLFTYRDNAGATRTLNVLTTAAVALDPLIATRILPNVPTVGNNGSVGDGLNTTGLSFSQTQNQNRDKYAFRFDVEASSRNSFSAVVDRGTEINQRPDVDNGGFNTTPFGFQGADRQSAVFAWRFSPTSNITNEVRGGWFFSLPAFDRTNLQTDFFLTLPLISSPESTFEAQGRDTHQWTLSDNAVWVKGEHSIRLGGQAQLFKVRSFGPPAFANSSIPTLTIGTGTATPGLNSGQFPGGISATQLATANSLLGLLGGFITSANQTFNATSTTSGFVKGALQQRNLRYENYSAYVADSWRVSPHLTLNLGGRYELYTPVKERDRLALEPVFADLNNPIASLLNPNGTYNFVGTNAGGNKFFKTDWNNFAPVLSFAWSPTFKNNLLGGLFPGEGRTVIRGGYRISYVNDEFVRGADNALQNAGLTQGITLTNLNLRTGSGAPAFTTPTFQVPRTYAQNNALAGNFGTAFGIDPNLQVPMTQEWNIGIQREIGFQSVVEVRYVGGTSNNLIRGLDYNQTDLSKNGFLPDFERARRNLARFNNPACSAADVIARGCELLTVFPLIEAGGLLSNSTIRNLIAQGQVASLGNTYVVNNFGGSSQLFLPNPNTGVADLLSNSAKYRYHGLQTEIRRRFTNGLQFQANYTFQKTLTNTGGVGQTNFDPALDLNNLQLEYQRADYDAAHVFNFNGIYELPFGKGKRFFNEGGVVDRVLGGWQFTSIVQIATGAPFMITDTRGTLNRSGRSARQTANTSLSKQGVKDLVGIFRTPCGVYFINPTVININQANLQAGNCTALGSQRGAEGLDTTPFNGQVFFNARPGQTGNMERNFLNGPLYANWDAGLIKNISLDFVKEGMRFQIRGEAFNVLNRANFFIGNISGVPAGTSMDVNSTNFGKVNSTFPPRIIQFVGRLEF